MERWWNAKNRGNSKSPENSLPQSYFVHHKVQMHWPEI